MIWFAALPLAAFVGVTLVIHQRQSEAAEWDWRDSFAAGTVVWSLCLFLITEFFGVVHALTVPGLALAWGCLSIASAVILYRHGDRPAFLVPAWSDLIGSWWRDRIEWQHALVSLVASCLLATLTVAILSPTNESDALEYHMGRVAHWAQNQSVSHYATPDARQIWSPPLAEYTILHFYILQGSDASANLVQWFGLLAASVVASRLASRFGAQSSGQALAALMVVTLPIAVSEATSTLNDLSLAYWVVVTAWALLLIWDSPLSWARSIAAGAATGLALLTKGSAVPYLAALGLAVLVPRSRELTTRKGLAIIASMGLIAVSVNGLAWYRNAVSFGSILGPAEHHVTLRASGSPLTSAISNNLRTTGVLAAVPVDPLNAITERTVSVLHRLVGLELNPPGATHPGARFDVGWRWPGANAAPVHLTLIVLASTLLAVNRRKAASSEVHVAVGAIGGFLLFNTLVAWQGSSRFWIPALFLAAPWTGSVLGRHLGRAALALSAVLLVVFAGPSLIAHPARPLISMPGYTFLPSVFVEADLLRYFRGNDSLASDYRELAQEASALACNQVGLRIDSGDPEYWWWVVLEPEEDAMRVEHLLFWPGLEKYQDPSFEPCVVLCTVCGEGRTSFAGQDLQRRLGSLTIFY